MERLSAGASESSASSSISHSESENSPLLPGNESSSPSSSASPHWKQRLARHVNTWKVVYLCGLFVLIIDFGENLRVVPELRLLELAVCRKYYREHDARLVNPNGDVDETHCKLDLLQSQLAMLRGCLALLKGLVQILTVIPFGVLADTKGRKLVLALSQTGLVLSAVWILSVCYFYTIFSVEAVLASALFLIVGGGSPVLNAMVFAMLADAVVHERRTKAFFYVSTANLVVELLAPPLGALILTRTSLYKALISGLALEFSGLLVLLIIPETLTLEPPLEGVGEFGSHGSTTFQDDSSTHISHSKGTIQRLKESLQHAIKRLRSIKDLVLTDRNIYLALPAFLVNRLPRQIMAVLLQYASKRLGWTLAKVRPCLDLLILLHQHTRLTSRTHADQPQDQFTHLCTSNSHHCSLLPPNSYHQDVLMKKLHFSSAKANLILAKWSYVALVLGCLIIGGVRTFVPLVIGLIVFALGWGFSNNIQLFVTSRVEKDQVAIIYTTLSIVDAIGALAGAPILAASFSAGLSLKGILSGLPFLVAGGIYALAGSSIWALGVE